MGGAAGGYYFTTMTTYSQCEYLYKPEGEKWLGEYAKGKAKAKDGFGTGIDMMQELIDAGAFDFDKNEGLWDSEIFNKRMATGEAAMMFLWGAQTGVAEAIEKTPDIKFELMPFRNREGTAFIGTTVFYNIGLSKKLGEKGNEKKLENALRIMEWLSTSEGINAVSADSRSSVFPLKNEENPEVFDMYQKLWDDNLDCIKAPMIYAGFEDVLVKTAEGIMDAVKTGGSLGGIADMIDELHGKYLEGGEAAIKIGSFEKDFTHEETVQLFADVLQSKGESDLSFVSDGTVKNGVSNSDGAHLKYFEGPLTEEYLTCPVPGSRLMEPAVLLKLTGAQIRELVEKGKHMIMSEGSTTARAVQSEENAAASAYFDYCWSGMKVEKKEGKVVSMTLDNGEEVKDGGIYTAAFAPGDYTEELAGEGGLTELEWPVQEALREYVSKNSPVKPGRVTMAGAE